MVPTSFLYPPVDPVNRRGVWDVIERAKHGRIVVLTTHAMEEAETLGDRIGIMSRGRLLCLGPTLHLKSAYGTGYTVDVTCDDASTPKVLEIVSRHSSQATQTGKAPCRIVAKVPQVQSSEVLPKLYRELAAAREAEGMQIDTALNMCTLEEVTRRPDCGRPPRLVPSPHPPTPSLVGHACPPPARRLLACR